MRSFKTAALCSFFILFQPLFSEAKVTRKPNQTEAPTIVIKSVYGDRTTQFFVYQSKDGNRVDFSNNVGGKGSRVISSDDFNFLQKKIAKISGSNDKVFCSRSNITIKMGPQEVVGCMGASNKVAREVQETTNLLSMLF